MLAQLLQRRLLLRGLRRGDNKRASLAARHLAAAVDNAAVGAALLHIAARRRCILCE